MTQGAVKASKPKAPNSSRRPTILGPKKGARTIAPKRAVLIKQKKLRKKISGGLIAKTESSLAERAGHLELLAGAKNKKEKDGGNDKEKHNKKKQKMKKDTIPGSG